MHFQRATSVGEVVHSDIIGPLELSYPYRFRNATTFQDDCSRDAYVAFMHRKRDLPDAFMEFVQKIVEGSGKSLATSNVHPDQVTKFSQVQKFIKCLHSDQSKDYIRLKKYLLGGV